MSEKLPPQILVVENDNFINANIRNNLERHWFDVRLTNDLKDIINIVKTYIPNLAIISSNVTNISAVELANELYSVKNIGKIPIIFLSDKKENVTDYLGNNGFNIKTLYHPIDQNILLETIRLMLKKSKPALKSKKLVYNGIMINLATYQAFFNNQEIHLGPTEFKILKLFLHNPKDVYSRKQIINYIWGEKEKIAERTIDVHINRIRSVIKKSGADFNQNIKTVRSIGYCLDY